MQKKKMQDDDKHSILFFSFAIKADSMMEVFVCGEELRFSPHRRGFGTCT